jgi:hypothetical protein
VGRLPSQKGTSVLPVVLALKQIPNGRKRVPVDLWKYLDEPVLISAWYPERDYWQLVSALVGAINPAQVGGDVWRYFARFSAQRDIGGQSKKAAPDDPAAGAGVYRSFAAIETTDFENFFRLASRLWSQYHDTGRMEVVGADPDSNAVIMRLIGFVIPLEGFVRLQGYYLEEYARLIGINMVSKVTKNTATGDSFCEWHHQLARSPATEEYIASLPVAAELSPVVSVRKPALARTPV